MDDKIAMGCALGGNCASGGGDGDGFGSDIDCDDTDPSINPEAPELCDGLDNDCNGIVDGDCKLP